MSWSSARSAQVYYTQNDVAPLGAGLAPVPAIPGLPGAVAPAMPAPLPAPQALAAGGSSGGGGAGLRSDSDSAARNPVPPTVPGYPVAPWMAHLPTPGSLLATEVHRLVMAGRDRASIVLNVAGLPRRGRAGARAEGVALSGDDLSRLRPERDLNDSIVQAFLHQVNVRAERQGRHVHAFSTFFATTYRLRGFDGVKSWAVPLTVLSMDMLAVPIHGGVRALWHALSH